MTPSGGRFFHSSFHASGCEKESFKYLQSVSSCRGLTSSPSLLVSFLLWVSSLSLSVCVCVSLRPRLLPGCSTLYTSRTYIYTSLPSPVPSGFFSSSLPSSSSFLLCNYTLISPPRLFPSPLILFLPAVLCFSLFYFTFFFFFFSFFFFFFLTNLL